MNYFSYVHVKLFSNQNCFFRDTKKILGGFSYVRTLGNLKPYVWRFEKNNPQTTLLPTLTVFCKMSFNFANWQNSIVSWIHETHSLQKRRKFPFFYIFLHLHNFLPFFAWPLYVTFAFIDFDSWRRGRGICFGFQGLLFLIFCKFFQPHFLCCF